MVLIFVGVLVFHLSDGANFCGCPCISFCISLVFLFVGVLVFLFQPGNTTHGMLKA